MSDDHQHLLNHLLERVRQVQQTMGIEPAGQEAANAPLANLLDSMDMVEFLTLLAADCATTPAVIEQSMQRQFGSLSDLARALLGAGLNLAPTGRVGNPSYPVPTPAPVGRISNPSTCGWLAAIAVHLPAHYQPAAAINNALHRPPGWLEQHAGIHGRRLWGEEDPLAAAADVARRCLAEAQVSVDEVGALLVTSEAPPLPVGLAAAMHGRLHLGTNALAFEIGSACTGFLAALRVAHAMIDHVGTVLVLALEAHSRYLTVQVGEAGENAALFGDAAAACLITDHPVGRAPVALCEVHLGVDGSAGNLLRAGQVAGGFELHMDGAALAIHAVRALNNAIRDVLVGFGLTVEELHGVVVHAGNGRMADLLARQLNLTRERIWSETAATGNLGSASLPVAWAARQPVQPGPVVWAAVGAGLTWGAVLAGLSKQVNA